MLSAPGVEKVLHQPWVNWNLYKYSHFSFSTFKYLINQGFCGVKCVVEI